jgi:hypothetical protein
MEQVYKKGSKYFGMSSGLMYTKEEVGEVNGDYWHCHPSGMPVIEVAELEGYDTRTHGGYPITPGSKKERE